MAEDRTYPVRNPEIVSQMQEDYLAKIQLNKEAGRKAFETGSFKPYNGVSKESTEKPFYVMLMLDNESAQQIKQRIVDPFEGIAHKYGIPAIFTSRGDLPPHISLDLANFNDMTPQQEKVARNWIMSPSSHLDKLTPILTGLKFHMDTLVVGPNSYICSSRFNAEQGAPYKARRIIEKAMRMATKITEIELEESVDGNITSPPSRYDDILHISVARITHIAPSDILLDFLKEAYSSVGDDLNKNPLPVTTSGVYEGRPFDFYKNFAPQLLQK